MNEDEKDNSNKATIDDMMAGINKEPAKTLAEMQKEGYSLWQTQPQVQ
jgi:hypothetical protein